MGVALWWEGASSGRGIRQATYQMLQDPVSDVEFGRSGAAHIQGIAQVVNGEVDSEGLLVDLASCGG